MNFSNPWDNIDVSTLTYNEIIQYFDSRIHIVYVLYGAATAICGNETMTLNKDDYLIILKNKQYKIVVEEHSKAFYFVLDYFGKQSQDKYTIAFNGNSIDEPKMSDKELIQKLKQLLYFKTLEEEGRYSEIYKHYFSLIELLEENYTITLREETGKSIRSRIEDLKFYIENNFEKNIRLSDLASQLFVTEQYLSKVFKEQNGIGVSEYLIKQRLAKVRQLLIETEDNVTDIAFATGFSNINSFNRIFKKYQGLTPTEFRTAVKADAKINIEQNNSVINDKEVIHKYLKEDMRETKEDSVIFDLTHRVPYKVSQRMINLGYAGDLLQSSLVKEIERTVSYTTFIYGRLWGLMEDNFLKQNGREFDFSKIDEVIQNVLDLHLKPFIDLGFKGKTIHESVENIIYYEVFTLPYNDMESLLFRYQSLMEHLIYKFGYDEVASWKIELWRPNAYVLDLIGNRQISLWSSGDDLIDLTQTDGYIRYFQMVKEVLNAIIPDVEIGGSGISLNLEEDYEDFLEVWSKERIKPDFLTFTAYSLDIMRKNEIQHKDKNLISANQEFLKDSLKKARACMVKYDLPQKLYLAEFNLTNSARDIINDSAFKGPFIVKNILEISDICDLIGYWQLSDISFTSFDVNRRELFGGAGLISKSGLPKPSFYAFDFINALGNEVILVSNGIIITKKRRKIIALAYHYCHFNGLYYFSNQAPLNQLMLMNMFDQVENKQLLLRLEGVPDKEYTIKKRIIGVSEGSVLTESNKISNDNHFSREELSYLTYRCIPSLEREICIAINQTLDYRIELAPHDMVLIEIDL
ncbi:helix-turn-helix domain-containing protein [Tuanshanicoccus lijuaniae]|uniref:GH39 family glycosyl hydrolase n=1 Tax=Aerococcaceae bacterium zg-1292 TaxID=2774330 RepID=UPI001935FFF6|nr:helix-turn-helix domain-containing protein [Aerococcaceae bacterium zg-1292]QQA36874.1 helix-turn-helix domain-containing protein [Aerococcaceae bacterium zg-1292]